MEGRRPDAPEVDGPPPSTGIFPISTWLPKSALPFPICLCLRRYQFVDFRGDLLAGLTVAAVLIPQGMSYSVLAGLPPIYGLFAGLMPMFSYSFFGALTLFDAVVLRDTGTSRELSVGPAAMVSLTVPSAIESLANAVSGEMHQEYYATLAGTSHIPSSLSLQSRWRLLLAYWC